ncbi:MAG: hypothetical protein JRN37_05965 [Nitrososphaerota archaeon]|nr:hypothetical protein [Nitrososphaerota archaeon]MDG7038683.1 hypothetical protein [Nitrososphaerota archaeon]MDG7043699.1 hypothetical protein [Nitrososphaerota archaeon]
MNFMKALFLLLSGKESPEKFRIGLRAAARSVAAKRYDDLKIVFFGPSEELIGELKDEDLQNFESLFKAGAIDSACIAEAQHYNVEEKLKNKGVVLGHAGERIAFYVNSGYTVISF